MDETQTQSGHEDAFREEPSSAVEAVERVIREATRSRASDAHIDPRERDVLIRLRIDGELQAVGALPKRLHEETVARLKILSGARTDIHAVPQDGRWQAEVDGRAYNIRVSFMPSYRGENAVLRLLPVQAASQDSFASLGFTPDHAAMMTQALSAPNGLILVTGPTGSGKTTTLRVCLGLKAVEPISVMTLEDPVEYEVPGVRHIHIRHTHGVTFATGLRAALRQDPDVIMVGEIRDAETARTAVHMALTGHLVLSTLHTTSAIETVLRLADMGVERYLIAATLRLVVGQRLVKMVCRGCGGAGGACSTCNGSGLAGRSVIAEALTIDDGLREAIGRGDALPSLRSLARSGGFRPISEDAAEKSDWGITTAAETLRALAF